jgi:hypothetical protein
MMIFIETKQLGQGWTMQIKVGKRTTYALQLRGYHIKTFWSEQALQTWLEDLGVNLNEKAGA